jgi:hypothetical protein
MNINVDEVRKILSNAFVKIEYQQLLQHLLTKDMNCRMFHSLVDTYESDDVTVMDCLLLYIKTPPSAWL